MKNCPFCKAEIEENARFCLYCMKPLAQKEVIAPAKRRSLLWLWILLGLAALLLVGCFLGILLGQTPPDTPEDQTTGSTAASASPTGSNPSEDTIPSEESKPSEEPNPSEGLMPSEEPDYSEGNDSEVIVPTPCQHSYTLTDLLEPTCSDDGYNEYTCDNCGDSYQDPVLSRGHSYAPATCTLPKICTECNHKSGSPLGHSYSGGYCFRCEAPDYSDPRVVFEYRTMGGGDYFDYTSSDDLVIIGLKNATPDGVYNVPAFIDGKRVVGIMAAAFSGSNAKKIILGENITRVNQYAFSGCYDIEEVYIKSDALYLSRSAFTEASSRHCQLTIYCSTTCMVDDSLYGERYLKDLVRVYSAEWKEWNGE